MTASGRPTPTIAQTPAASARSTSARVRKPPVSITGTAVAADTAAALLQKGDSCSLSSCLAGGVEAEHCRRFVGAAGDLEQIGAGALEEPGEL